AACRGELRAEETDDHSRPHRTRLRSARSLESAASRSVTDDRGILVVCTANQCRSPLAAALLQAELERRGVDLAVSSAGLLEEQQPVTEATSAVAHALNLDLSRHESRRLVPSLVRNAELVIGMERHHVREAVVLDPSAWSRTFTLKEIVRRAEALGGRGDDEAF